MFIAEDLARFKRLFASQLKAMLADDQLGAFILVLANSLQDEYLKEELAADLKNNYEVLKQAYLAGTLKAPADDMDVFAQLLEMDIGGLPVWQTRTTGDWEVTFNTMRQLRPARASKEILNSIIQPFDKNRFHFNKPFLRPEILWQGEHKGVALRVLYNKFPFAPYHLLIAIMPEDEVPQVLAREQHDYIFSLAAEASQAFPGFAIGYNSLAAGASVNHLHFQGFIRKQPLAIEEKVREHNGGALDYPLRVRRFSAPAASWEYIGQLTAQDTAFNCLYRSGNCYVVPRKYQGAVALPDWLDGAGWLDVAGGITVSDRKTFDALDDQSIARALGMLKLSVRASEPV
ncbi:MAG TPA: hypothetical protein ENI98_00370 [Gammaproteobacteria bacterium]|nr:hypothetical protein [Gammaproteobacteria bacterium]